MYSRMQITQKAVYQILEFVIYSKTISHCLLYDPFAAASRCNLLLKTMIITSNYSIIGCKIVFLISITSSYFSPFNIFKVLYRYIYFKSMFSFCFELYYLSKFALKFCMSLLKKSELKSLCQQVILKVAKLY